MKTQIVQGLFALALAGSLFAGPLEEEMDRDIPQFTTLDKNGNGSIDRTEAREFPDLDKIFSQFDEDKNGVLLEDEYRKAVRRLKS